RACGYSGHAEYDTIRSVKQSTRLPVIANGDITTPEEARYVLQYTGADGVMIGRAAQGRPWIFREIDHYLRTGETLAPPSYEEMRDLLLEHLDDHYRFYGEHTGVRSARKHIGWYVEGLPGADPFRDRMNRIDNTRDQWQTVADWFDDLARGGPASPAPRAQPLLAA
ncbi:MAG TPA: tRNA-dihydrouridine synthase, partial [Bordetella sp.]|nr:tRNA-dihydrouridine synthase [Bordetella sp.]